MKYFKIILIGFFALAMSSCISYKDSVVSGYNPDDIENIYHIVHE
ncbi:MULTISPECIES: hypothetical protein [unclassified Flammeovirga]|nr:MULTISPECIES: hypothetical protein [unclassified Flammeovirga]